MKPYDPDAKCPKCGHEDVATSYHGGGQYAHICCLVTDQPHLCRYCRRCGYEWPEACLPEGECDDQIF